MGLFTSSSHELLPKKEDAALLAPEQLTYKGIIKHIALTVVKRQHKAFSQLSFLKDSPMLKVAPYIEDIVTNPNMTAISPSPMSKEGKEMFDFAFERFCELAHVNKEDVPVQATKIGLKSIKNVIVRPTDKPSSSFEQTFTADEQRIIERKIPTENSITRENGVHWQNCEWEYQSPEESAHKLQLALATGLAFFLRNQANMAGQINHQIPSSNDKNYANFIKKTYFSKLANSHPPMLKIEWDILAPGPLATELKRLFPSIPEYSDSDVNDMTSYFPEGCAIPKTNHMDFENNGLNVLSVPLLHPNGRHYLTYNVKELLSMGSGKLAELFVLPTSTNDHSYNWKNIEDLSKSENIHNYPFAIRMDWLSDNHPISPIEHNFTNFLNISCNASSNSAKLEWRSGHFPSDGAIRGDTLDKFSEIIAPEIIPPKKDFIQKLRSRTKQVEIGDLKKASSVEDFLKVLSLGKIIVGTTFSSESLKNIVEAYNSRLLAPNDTVLSEFITVNPDISSEISTLLHQYGLTLDNKQPVTTGNNDHTTKRRSDVVDQIKAMLNPRLSTVDAISIASEDTCTSATCALPYSPLRRLVTYASDHINKAVRKISESFNITIQERVLSKLGHGWQSNISVSVRGVEKFTQESAKKTSEKLARKSSPIRQISDLGQRKNNNYFITALSAKIDELSAGIGISGDYITERVDLEKPDFISSLPLHTPMIISDIDRFSQIWGHETENTRNRLYKVNDLLTKTRIKSYIDILKAIADLEPDNPSLIIEQFLIAKTYLEL